MTLEIKKIETDDSNDHYEQTASVWFGNGSRIRWVEAHNGMVYEQSFVEDDPHSVWDDFEIGDEDFDEVFVVALEVLYEELRDGEPYNWTALEQCNGNERSSPTNVRYEH